MKRNKEIVRRSNEEVIGRGNTEVFRELVIATVVSLHPEWRPSKSR